MSDVRAVVGFRPSEPFGDGGRIGWRAWVGPLIVARVDVARPSVWRSRGDGWALEAFGLSVGWVW